MHLNLNKKALTLVEIIVAMLILVTTLTGIFSVFISGRRYIARSKRRLQAINLARQLLEELKTEVRQDTWDTGRLSLGNNKDCDISLEELTPGASCRYDVEQVQGADYRRVTVRITWNEP